MSHLLIVKRLELYMDLALYKINILLLLFHSGVIYLVKLYDLGYRTLLIRKDMLCHIKSSH